MAALKSIPSALLDFQHTRQALSEWFTQAASLPCAQISSRRAGEGEQALPISHYLNGLSEKITADTFRVAILGEYSSGKSSLLNVLLRLHTPLGRKTEGLLPTNISPTTAVVTLLSYAPEQSIELLLDDGSRLQADPGELNGYLSEPQLRRRRYWWQEKPEENEQIADRIREVHVGCPSPLLEEGVNIVDTPGIGSIHKDHARITEAYLAHIDAALFLVSVDPPMGEREMTFLQHVASITERFFFVQTKRDLGERREGGEQVWVRLEREHRGRIGEVVKIGRFPLFSVSALQAAHALREGNSTEFAASGFQDLEQDLAQFLVRESGQPRLDQWRRQAEYWLDLMEQELNTEAEQIQALRDQTRLALATQDEYRQLKEMREMAEGEFRSQDRELEGSFFKKHDQLHGLVIAGAEQKLTALPPEKLAQDSDTRFKLERQVLADIQYHQRDLFYDHIEVEFKRRADVIEQAMGNLPPIFRRFALSAEWSTADSLVSFGEIAETKTRTETTYRGGLGLIDLFFGPKQEEIKEHIVYKERFTAIVGEAVEQAYRQLRANVEGTLEEMRRVFRQEMGRLEKVARDTTDRQAALARESEATLTSRLSELAQSQSTITEARHRLVLILPTV